ncbi:LysR family transcriptional regulator [Pigmentiphaga soli]|uniref:LysR family transcriptional regulator n=1 Tax=Pigmentiphaga soli TaxID=1007095 RepID=A0ABP8GQG6_9BURK
MEPVSDLSFFVLVAEMGSLRAVAQELGVTPPVVSKRLAAIERHLGVRLLNRTTRRSSITPEGRLYLEGAQRILGEIAELEQHVTGAHTAPKGLLRVEATLGFGRLHIGPAMTEFARRYPEVELQLHLSDGVSSARESMFDIAIRFGEPADGRIIARRLACNRRRLYAAPRYLERAGTPQAPEDLADHSCIVIRESEAAYGTWRLESRHRRKTVKVRGPVSTNHGEVALSWALAGQGIVMRSEWEAAAHVRAGKLRTVLDSWSTPDADIYAVYPERMHMSSRVRSFLDFLLQRFERQRGANGGAYW